MDLVGLNDQKETLIFFWTVLDKLNKPSLRQEAQAGKTIS